MLIVRAFWAETLRSFDFKGRSARAPYFGFLFVATMLFAIVIWLVIALLPQEFSWAGVCIVIALFYIPVTAAGVRRLHDAGESGTLMLDPIKPLAAFGICLLLIGSLYLSSKTGFIVMYVTLALFGKLAIALLSIAALLVAALSLMFFSNTMGILLLPSQPDTNAYGPNPNELQA